MNKQEQLNKIPPANGYVTWVRRLIAMVCLGWFCYFLFLEFVLGTIAKPVPVWLYGLLFMGSLMMFEAIDKVVQGLVGKFTK